MTYIQQHWNKVVRREGEKYAVKSRDRIRASEVGYPYINRYCSMLGIQPTNPFSDRTLRIFDAGRVVEFLVLRALAMAGILNKQQKYVSLDANKKHLRVTGYLDATIGGFSDWAAAQKLMQENLQRYSMGLDDELLDQKAEFILAGLQEQYPGGYTEEMVVEVKSISSRAFWGHKNRDDDGNFLGYPHHQLQTYAYLEMTGMRQGVILYLSKDDFTLAEVLVLKDDPELKERFYDDLVTMSEYYRKKIVPPKEPEIVYNERKGKFEKNWNVSNSLYLKYIYGYADEDAYNAAWHKTLLGINLALKHMRANKVVAKDLGYISDYGLESYVEKIDTDNEDEDEGG